MAYALSLLKKLSTHNLYKATWNSSQEDSNPILQSVHAINAFLLIYTIILWYNNINS